MELETRPSKHINYHNFDGPKYDILSNPSEGPKRNLKSITKKISNFKDLQYFGTLYIGPNKQKMTFIYDTGSSWFWIPTDLCQD
jgi:hypothetical protein